MSMVDGDCNEMKDADCLLRASGLRKTYGHTLAISELDFSVSRGEIIGLVGANGAGKSTLMKIVSGVVVPDSGEIIYENEKVQLQRHSPAAARKLGIRVVHQELSLCKNLRVYENFYVEQSQRFKTLFGWRKKAAETARRSLDAVFPRNGIDVNVYLDSLSIAQQQMVEIARAVCDEKLKLLILDEPTASLPAEQTAQLQDFLLAKKKENVSIIFISHRLKEVICLADTVFIMKNGQKKWSGEGRETCEDDLIAKMGEGEAKELAKAADSSASFRMNEDVCVEFRDFNGRGLKNIGFKARGGEIIGLAGLEGSGQLSLIHEIYAEGKRGASSRIKGSVAFVAGDRKKEGNFHLWSIVDNMIISKIANNRLFSILSSKKVQGWVAEWTDRLKIKSESSGSLITSLSGGNQQKVLIARAMIADADIILLDDPTRGVDVATKNLLYEIFQEAAAKGKLMIWRSSDDFEFGFCTKIFVMSFGHLTAQISSAELAGQDILKASFSKSGDKKKADGAGKAKSILNSRLFLPVASMVAIYLLCGALNPGMFGLFGIELLISGFAPFVFAALAQAFIIGLGHVDLGIGAYMGLVNVICASYLKTNPPLGWALLGAAIALYAFMGVLIYARNIPPIIVTLGMSFVWSGVAYAMMNMPGGETPAWLSAVFNTQVGFLSSVTVSVILAAVLAAAVYSTKYGTVLRGFGNNDQAMRNSGWSKMRAYIVAYALAGFFGLLGGAAFSGITGAADANASKSFTLLTIAAVVMGGGKLEGGVVSHFGAVLGAVSLSLIQVLLGFMNVNTDFTAAIQGIILLSVLAMGLVKKESSL